MKKKKHKLFFKRKRKKTRAIYNQSDINAVMYKLGFVETISDFIPLKKTGADYATRCPFCRIVTKNNTHFRVSDRLNRYKCFECGVAGNNAISFLMRYYNVSFDEIISFVDINYTKIGIKPERYRPIKQEAYIDDHMPF